MAELPSTAAPDKAAESGPVEAGDEPKHAAAQAAAVDQPQDSPPEAEPAGWVRRGDQLIVGGLVMAAIVLMAVHWARLSGWGLEPVEIDRLPERQFDFQLEINSATWVEWLQLEGIGNALAQRIIDDRELNGPFADIDDVARVKGIGPKTIERIRPWLRVGPRDEDDQSGNAD